MRSLDIVFSGCHNIQGGSADVWKENILEDLEAGETEYESAREFLVELKREFGGGDEKVVKVAELRKLEQEGRTMEEFVQEFKWVVRESRYKRRLLIEEFKREINEIIWRKLIEAEELPKSIEQWYKCATNINRHWRESKRDEERLRRRQGQRGSVVRHGSH